MNMNDEKFQIEVFSTILIIGLFLAVFTESMSGVISMLIPLVIIQVGRWFILRRDGSLLERPIRKMNDEELRKWIV